MPAISTNLKFLLGIIASIAGILAAVTGNELSKSIILFLTGKRPGRKPTKRTFRVWFAFLLTATITVVFGSLAAFAPTAKNNIDDAAVVTVTQSSPTLAIPTLTNTPSPAMTLVLPTSTSVFTPSAELEPMVFVPAGQFMMGSNNGDDEKPIHKVYLDAFSIDQTEVTNSMYDRCVRAGQCKPPQFNRSAKRDYYYGNPEFDNYPVILVSWDDASAYCAWVNRRLPTEAEWEKAARGIDGRIYPWGGVGPSNMLLNYNANVGDTTEVGKYPDGKSPYGAFDMAGNVWEWVADWYDPNYYSISPTANPTGATVGEYHVLRGGSWYSPEEHITVTTRETKGASFRDDIIGFRCAKSEP